MVGVADSDGFLAQFELTGEGAYDGLSALFGLDNSTYPVMRWDGWIFEGELPPMPEPVEATATTAWRRWPASRWHSARMGMKR